MMEKFPSASIDLTGGQAVDRSRQHALKHTQLVIHNDAQRLEDACSWVDGAFSPLAAPISYPPSATSTTQAHLGALNGLTFSKTSFL